jgi:WD40 repeat protein
MELWRHFARRNRVALRVASAAALLLVALAAAAFVRIARERDLAQKSQLAAERELRRSEGVVASRLSPEPLRRLEALALGVRAVAPELRLGDQPAPEALQGLLDALTAGPIGVPLRHQGAIVQFASTPDGALLLAVDDARQVLVFDARSGERRSLFTTSLPEPQRIAASPDGHHAVVCGNDPAFELFDLLTGQRQRQETKNDVAVCTFRPDGRLLIGAEDVTVRDPTTLAVERRLPSATPVSAIAQQPGGVLAVGSFDGAVVLWPAQRQPRTLRASGPLPRGLRFDPAGRWLLVFDADQGIRQLSLTELPAPPPRLLHRTEEGNSSGFYASPDGRILAAPRFELDGRNHTALLAGPEAAPQPPRDVRGGALAWSPDPRWFLAEDKGPLWLVDAASGGAVLSLPLHTDEALAHFAGPLLATASRDGPAALWDLATGEETGMLLGHTGALVLVQPLARGLLPDQSGARALTASLDGTARLFKLSTGEEEALLAEGTPLLAATVATGAFLAVGGLDGTLRATLLGGAPFGADLAPGGGPVAVVASAPSPAPGVLRLAAGALDGRLQLLLGQGGVRELVHTSGAVTALAFAADGGRLASGHADGSTHLWELGGREAAVLPDTEPTDEPGDHDGHAHLAFFGASLLAGRPAGHTLVLDAQTLALRGRLDGRLLASGAAALSPDGARAVTASGEGLVFVHSLPAPGQAQPGMPLRLEGHRTAVLSAAFSPSGKRLVTGAIDGNVRVWDLTTGRGLVSLGAPGLGPATAVAMPDDDHALAGHASGALRLHPVTAAAALQRACGLLRRFAREEASGPDCAGR